MHYASLGPSFNGLKGCFNGFNRYGTGRTDTVSGIIYALGDGEGKEIFIM
jgi:hypothetical protein